MYPKLLGVELYYPMLALSVLAQLVLLFWLIQRAGFTVRQVILYVALLSVLGFLGAKGFSILFHGGVQPLAREVVAGYRYPGAVIAILGFGYGLRCMLPKGLSYAQFMDLWAPSFALSCGLGRLGCLLTGCCYGAVSYLPWSIRYPRGSSAWWEHYHQHAIPISAGASLPVHPLPLYLFVMEMGVLVLTLVMQTRKAYDGQVVLVFLVVHGVAKFLIEYFRHPYNLLHQSVVLIALVAGVILLWRWISLRRICAAKELTPKWQD